MIVTVVEALPLTLIRLIDYFQQKQVDVFTYASNRNLRKVRALTYVLSSLDPDASEPWSLNQFVRRKSFRRFSNGTKTENYNWIAEEKRIANQIGVKYAMIGDNLCDRILNNDVDGVNNLIAECCDVDAPCHYWGTPLQAAAAKGHDSIVYIMTKYPQADPKSTGGKYYTPLIAAIFKDTRMWFTLCWNTGPIRW